MSYIERSLLSRKELVFTKSSKYFLNILFFFVLNPYVSPIPTGSDIQPLVGLLAAVIFLVIFVTINNVILDKSEVYFLLLSMFIIVVPTMIGPSSFELRKRIGLFFSLIIYYIFSRTKNSFSFKVLLFSTLLNFSALVFQIISPSVFKRVVGLFLRAVKFHEESGRGFTGLAPEPSFWGYSLIFHILLLDYFGKKETINRKLKLIIIVLSSVIIVMTKSGTSYLFSLLFIGIWLLGKIKYKKIVIASFILIWSVLLLIPKDNIKSRGLTIILSMAQEPEYILMDSSIASRINQITIGSLALFEYPLGTGGGSFLFRSKNIYLDNHLSSWYKIPKVRNRVEKELFGGAISTYAQYSIELGFLYIILLVLLYKKLNYNQSNIFVIVVFVSIAILQSFPVVYPPVWFLLAIYKKEKKEG